MKTQMQPQINEKNTIIKNCAPFTDYMSEINNTQIVNAKNIDVVMPMYNLREYSDHYFKTEITTSQFILF